MNISRRLLLVSTIVISGLTVAACGDAPAGSIRAAASTPPVVHVAGGGTAEGGAGVGSSHAASTADSKMLVRAMHFSFDGDASALPTSAGGYRLRAGQAVDAERVARMAAALGVPGTATPIPADQGGGWQVGSSDYTQPGLTVSADGSMSWWYNPGTTDIVAPVACAVAVDPTVGEGVDPAVGTPETPTETVAPVDPCPTPEPPANVPGAAAAQAKATALLSTLGFDAGQFVLDVHADEWGATVTATLRLDGLTSPITQSFSFGGDAALTWAGGMLGVPESVGAYPLVNVADAVDRLNAQNAWLGDVMSMARAGAGNSAAPEASADSGASASGASGVPGADAPMPVDSVLCDPAADCGITPEPVEPLDVHLTGVHLGLTMVWDSTGDVWVLPAYVFTDADGAEYTVTAVDDSFLVDDSATVTTEPATPVATDGVAPDTAVSPPATVGATETLPPASPSVEGDVGAATAALVGLDTAAAAAAAEANGWGFRIVRIDGVDQPVTMDYSPTRVNVAVEGSTVAAVINFG